MALDDLNDFLSTRRKKLTAREEAAAEPDLSALIVPPDDPGVTERLADIPMNLASLLYHGVTEPISTVEAIGSAAKKSLIDETVDDPLSWVPFLAEAAGTTAGSLGLGPFGPAVGALAGRFTGELIDSLRTGKPLFSNEKLTNMVSAPLFSLPIGTGIGYLKGKIAPLEEGSAAAVKALPKTIVEPIAERVPKSTNIDQLIQEAWQKAAFLREAAYKDKPEKMLLSPMERLMPKVEEGIIPHVLDNEAAQLSNLVPEGLLPDNPVGEIQKRLLSARGQAAVGKMENYAEEVKRMKLARPKLPTDIMDDFLDLQRMGIAAPEAVNQPLVTEMKKIGLAPTLFSPQRELRKYGDPNLERIADVGLMAQELRGNIADNFKAKAVELMKQHNISKDDYGLFIMLERNPELMAAARNGEINLRNAADKTNLERVMKFTAEYQQEVNDPLFALARSVDPTPRKLAQYNPNFIFSSATAPRESQSLADDIERLTRTLGELPDEQKAGSFAQSLQEQISALGRKKTIADAQAGKVNDAIVQAERLFTRYGILPKEANFKPFLEKHTDLLFGADPVRNAEDYINGIARKLTLDVALPAMKTALEGVTDRRAYDYASKFIMAQTGQQKMATIVKIADNIKDIPGLKRFGNPQSVIKTLDRINQYLYLADIGLSPRFLPMNMLQNVLTLRPLVGDEAFAHGIAQVTGNWREVADRALKAGVIQPEDMKFFGEGAMTSTGNRLTRVAGALPQASEKFNRVLGYAAGEYAAQKAGLTGKALAEKAAAISKQTNFGYGIAEKPLLAGTPIGGLAYRFRSFSANYATFLKHLAETDKKKFAEAVVSAIGVAGTAGVPLYSWIRSAAASQGLYLPEVEPLTQVTGLDFGRSVDPFFTPPHNASELVDFAAGPLFGPVLKGTAAALGGDEQGIAFAVQRLMGPLASRVFQGAGELARGGETRTPVSRQLLTKRSPGTIGLSMLSFAPSARQARGRMLEDLEAATRARDPLAKREIFRRARDLGVYNLGSLASQAKAKVKRDDNQSIWSVLLGE